MNIDDTLEKVGQSLRGVVPALTLTFHPAAPHESFSRALGELAEGLARAAQDGIDLRQGDGAGLMGAPCLSIERRGSGRIDYSALPEGRETAPFVEILTGELHGPIELTTAAQDRLDRLDRPAHIVLFIATACPHCPQAVRAAARLVLASKNISVSILDAQRFPDAAARFKVAAAPTTIIDEGLTLTGVVPAAELAEHVLARGSVAFEKRVLVSLIETGQADNAASCLATAGGAPPFLPAWQESTTSLRLGLMLAAQKALGRNPGALNEVVPGLIDLLQAEDDALRGDTADLLGQIGHPDGLKALRPLLNDPNPDIAEIAAEALGLD